MLYTALLALYLEPIIMGAGSRKTCLLQAFRLVFHTFWLDTTWSHGLRIACRVHQKMAIAAGEPGIPASRERVILQKLGAGTIQYWYAIKISKSIPENNLASRDATRKCRAKRDISE